MKKFTLKRIITFALSAVLALSVCPLGSASGAETDITAGLTELEKTEGYQLVGEDSGMRLYLDTKTTNFYVEDTATGKKTYAFPENVEEDESLTAAQKIELQSALVFTFWDPVKKTENVKNSNGLCIKQGNYAVYQKDNGFLIEYELEKQQVSACLSVTLEDGKLLCSIPAGSIKEKDTEAQLLIRVAVLPYMLSGKADTEGKIILPDGCGEILDFGSSRAAAAVYSKPIYGRNLSTTLSVESKTGYDITCPYLAQYSEGKGVLAIPTKGAAVGYVNAKTAGKTTPYANAWFSFDYRASDIAVIGDQQATSAQRIRVFDDEVYNEDMTVSYQFIFSDASVEALARLYGEYLAPGSKASSDSVHSAIFDIYGFVNEQKSFLGFPYTSVSVLSKGEDIISLAGDEKLEGITLNLKSITKAQQKNTAQTSLNPVSKVLSASQLKALAESEAHVYINTNPLTFRKGSFWANSFFGAAKTIYGSAVGVYSFKESTHMADKNISKSLLLETSKITQALEKTVKSGEKLGIDGISSDELGSISYHDYSASGTLADTHAAQEEALKLAAESGGLILSNPNDYAIKYCSAVIDIPVDSSNNDLCSGSYPFIQIALGNKVSYAVESINLHRSPETMFLNALSTGAALHYSYILSDTEPITGTELNFLYSADYTAFKEMTERQYASWHEVNAATEGSGLAEYIREGNTATAVFENGARLTVDFSEKTYSVEK